MKNLREITKQYSVVFAGPVRNCGDFLEDVIKNIDSIGSLFKEYHCVFVESDSVDNSFELLSKYANERDNFHLITLGKIEPQIPSRTMRIAAARNVAIEYSENKGLLDNTDFYIQMCVDDVNAQEIDLEGVLSCFKYELESWDGMTANQNTYYDLWTLRKEGWLNYDCWYELTRNRPEYISWDEYYQIVIGSRFVKIPKNYGLIEVEAAHGGLSIYKSSMAKGCRYKGFNEENMFEESDIMEFCRGIKRKGGKIFINSELINVNNN